MCNDEATYVIEVQQFAGERPTTIDGVLRIKITRRGKLIVWRCSGAIPDKITVKRFTRLLVAEGCPVKGAKYYNDRLPPGPPGEPWWRTGLR